MRRIPLALLAVSVLPLAGCQEEEKIVHYRVPRLETFPTQHEGGAKAGVRGKVRFLAAIVPDRGELWFFKLVGPEAAVTPLAEPFEAFMKTVRLTGKEPPIAWDLPKDWEQAPGNQFRYATLKMKSEGEELELTVSKFGGTVLANVNRWREQIGLKHIELKQLPDETKTLDVAGVKITLVNMVGEQVAAAPPRFGKKLDLGQPKIPGAAPGKAPDFTVQTPAGWQEQVPASAITAKQYQAAPNVQVTITALGGDGGGIARNVNRWRTEQLKLPAAGDKELISLSSILDLGTKKALYVDMENPRETGKPRILAIVIAHPDIARPETTFFLKMMGPSDRVASQQASFEALAKSFRIEGK
ncbi:MAG: hypothetical protein L0Y71_18820 [Gemmataceae bacterium]|nr:hypothetical protein [Gemmataceae bacterium]